MLTMAELLMFARFFTYRAWNHHFHPLTQHNLHIAEKYI